MKKYIPAVLLILCLGLSLLGAGAAEAENKTVVTIPSGKTAADLQTYLDALPAKAGNVQINIESTLYSPVDTLDLSVPTDKGITSLTLSRAETATGTVCVYSHGYDKNTLRFFANGIPLIIDEGVHLGGLTTNYYSAQTLLFGGSADADLTGDTHITVNAGGAVNGAIYGGGYNRRVDGDTYVEVYGAYGTIHGGGYILPAADSGDLSADVTGAVTIVVDSQVVPEYEAYRTHSWYNSSIYGGGHVSTGFFDFAGPHTFSAKVGKDVSIYVNSLMNGATIFGGGHIFSQCSGGEVELKADIAGDVDIRIGERTQLIEDCVAPRSPFSLVGGGHVKRQISGNSDRASAQVCGSVTITAVDSLAAAVGQGGVNSIVGGGVTENGGANSDATVRGCVTIETSRNTLPFSGVGGVYHNVGVVGGGFSSGGTANVIEDVSIHIRMADGQAETYANVKNIVGGGVTNGAGTANVGGDVTIEVADDVRFEGGYAPGMSGSDYKLGVTGGGWVRAAGGTANVAGTVRIDVGKDVVFSADGERVIGGGKINGGVSGSAATGDIFVTLNGTAEGTYLEELFVGSFEGRSPSASATVTLKDSRVGWMYDKDETGSVDGNQAVTLRLLGKSQADQTYFWGWDHPKTYLVEAGDGSAPTEAALGYLDDWYGYDGRFARMDLHVYPKATLKKDGDGAMFTRPYDLTIDRGGALGIAGDETLAGDLTGGGTLELLKKDVRLRMQQPGAVFTGTVNVKAADPAAGQVVATTVQTGTQGLFAYDGDDFYIRKAPDAYGNYDWSLATLTAPTEASGLVYTGWPQPLLSAAGSGQDGVMRCSLDGENYFDNIADVTATDAGTYTVYYRMFQPDTGEALDRPRSVEAAITQAPNAITDLACPDVPYGQTPEPTAAAAFGEIAYTYSRDPAGPFGAWSAENPPGVWYVKATVPGTDNYQGAEVVLEFQVTPPHAHVWAQTWESDPDAHWHLCTATGCDLAEPIQMDGYGPHSPDPGTVTTHATLQSPGERTFRCTACQRVLRTEPIPQLSAAGSAVVVADGVRGITVDQPRLDAVAEAQRPTGGNVTVTLTVCLADAPQYHDAIAAIAALAGEQTVEYADLTLTKETVDENGHTETTPITDTGGRVLEIAVDFDFTGKRDVTVYRQHGEDEAETLKQNDTKADGTFRLEPGEGKVYIYASKFSVYAIGYTLIPDAQTGPATTYYYSIVASATEGGSISPAGRTRVRRGRDLTVTITPDEGYVVADVLVDRRSVGAVREYTFEKITTGHSIQAVFTWQTAGPTACLRDETCPLHPFADARPTAWYHDGVHFCLDRGLMQGYGHALFGPNDALTRAQLAQILCNKAGRPTVSGRASFDDVSPRAWYAAAIAWAAENGIVKGYGDGRFGPDDPITREQLAAMLYRWADKRGAPLTGALSADFPDAGAVSPWARAAMGALSANGVIQGKEDQRLDPQGSATRAEAATMLQRFCALTDG